MVEQPAQRISRRLGKAEYERHCRVYFIEAPTIGLVKIGYTMEVPKRFIAMLTMSAVPLSLLADTPGGPQLEAKLHDQFNADRSHGEWFAKTPAMVAVIAAAETQYDASWHNRTATYRGEKLQAYLDAMKAGTVTRPTRGPSKRPRPARPDRYAWSPEDPMRSP